jgi:ribose/xylose/arabinose/galactoside ABC-type transport system permease subunit
VLGVPLIVAVAAACALLGWFVLARTKLGRAAYAIGGNREAARVSGIRIGRSKFSIYVISGLLAAVAGMMLTGRLASANALMADGMELQSIAAVVVGGTNLFGGEGGVGGTMIGILIIGVLANGLSILGVAEFWQRVVNGLIIVAVVALDQWRRRAAVAGTAAGGSGGLKREAGTRAAGAHAEPSDSPPVNSGSGGLKSEAGTQAAGGQGRTPDADEEREGGAG